MDRNKAEIVKLLKIQNKILPSVSTIRRALIAIEFCEIKLIFENWTRCRVKIQRGDWISVDGKALCGTAESKHKETTIVSMFRIRDNLVLASDKVKQKSNEIPIVQKLIEYFIGKDVLIVADALHCQKETVKKIVKKESKYVIQVKKNQKKLYRKVKFIAEYLPSISENSVTEKNRGRLETRIATVHNLNLDLQHDNWDDLKHIVCIKRTTEYKGKTTYETAYFITNAELDAMQFNIGIRGHWRIENSLHYVKDVTMREDALRIKKGNAPQNFSVIRSFILNLLRLNGFNTILSTFRRISSKFEDILGLFSLQPLK